MSKINFYCAAGLDRITGTFFRELSSCLSLPLCKSFRASMLNGEMWHLANVCPIFKEGNKNDIANYRPTSLICIACKIMETIIK